MEIRGALSGMCSSHAGTRGISVTRKLLNLRWKINQEACKNCQRVREVYELLLYLLVNHKNKLKLRRKMFSFVI